MDSRIASTSRPDIVLMETAPRPTPVPARVSFSQVLTTGVSGLVQGAELAASALPGSSLAAAAVRGGATAASSPFGGLPAAASLAEGPGAPSSSATAVGLPSAIGVGVAGATTGDPTGSIDATLQQSAQLNLYYLQIQQEVDAQNRTFTTLSNVLKTEHDTAKSAISNVHS